MAFKNYLCKMDSETNNHKISNSCVLSTKQNPQKITRRERRKIIHHIRRLSTIDEIEMWRSISLVTTKSDDTVNSRRSSSGKSMKELTMVFR